MIKSGSLKRRVRINLMIGIPLLIVILVAGSQVYSFYIIRLNFLHLVNDQDIVIFDQVINFLSRQIWISSLAAGIFGVILAYAITLPIKKLTLSAKHVAVGDLTRVVQINNEDEIGALGKSFNAMISSLNEHIIESMTGGVITINMKGIIVTFNRSAELILGYDSDEVIGTSVFEFFPEHGKNREFRKVIEDTLTRKATSSSQEIYIYSRSGKKVPIGITTSLLRDKKNTFLGVVVTFKDLGQIKNLEDQMRRADRLAAVGSLAAGIAHEIRNPLGSVKGLVQLLQEDLKEDKRKRSYTEVIVKEVDRLNKVVEELLSFAKADDGDSDAEMVPVNVNDVIEATLSLAEHDSKKEGVSIEKDFAEKLPPVSADPKKLQQAFLNIIINAFAAMEQESGTLRIRTEPADNSVLIRFADTGCGIPQNLLNKIFDPFFTSKQGGTGLGLTITHQIISRHKGKLDVKTAAGEGTEFIISLPVRAEV